MDILALALAVDHAQQGGAIGVLVALRLERAAEAVDQIERHGELLLPDPRLARRDVVRRADFVGEEHLLEDQHPAPHADAPELLLVAHHVARDSDEPRLLHRPHEQRVRLLAARRGPEVARALEEDRIDFVHGNEVLDVDSPIRLARGRLEILVGHVDVLALGHLVAADDLVVRDRLSLLFADLLVPDPRVVLLVQEVEADVLLVDRAVHPHRDVDEAERDRAGPDRARHGSPTASRSSGGVARPSPTLVTPGVWWETSRRASEVEQSGVGRACRRGRPAPRRPRRPERARRNHARCRARHGHGAARPEREREVDAHAGDRRHAARHIGLRDGARRAGRLARPTPARRVHDAEPGRLRRPHGPRERPVLRPPGRGGRHAGGRGRRAGRPRRRCRQCREPALGRPALPRLARDGARRTARAARSRRADGRPRPAPAARPLGVVRAACGRRGDAPRLEPRHGRGRALRRAPARPRRAAPRPWDGRRDPCPRRRRVDGRGLPTARRDRGDRVSGAVATSARVLLQVRRDPRTIALLLLVPIVLIALLDWLFVDQPGVFDRIGAPLLGLFPFIAMFVVTSITMLRERTTGTLERLMTLPLTKLGLLGGYSGAFALAATVQAALAFLLLGLDVAGSPWLIVLLAILNAVLGSTLGLFASAFARTEFQAVQFMPAFVMPQLLLCGLFVPTDEMARPLEILSYALPLT